MTGNGVAKGYIPTSCLLQEHSSFMSTSTFYNEDTRLYSYAWYHGPISRLDAQKFLEYGFAGCFLVRESESIPGGYSITLRANDIVYHYRLNL